MSYIVYELLDYKGYTFYVGITRNWPARYTEHCQCKGNNPKKDYRVRRSIEVRGSLDFKTHTCETEIEARALERELINKYKHQIVNVQHGLQKSRAGKKGGRKTERAQQCPYCKNWYRRLSAHNCPKKP